MKHVIEKSMADRKFIQAEEQCKHLLVIAPDDEFGKEQLEKLWASGEAPWKVW